MTCAHALHFSKDLKLAHYVKIPPRHTFTAQIVATFVSSFVATSILNFQMSLPDVCTPTQKNHYTCPGVNTFFTAAVMWGTVGPKKVFGSGGLYTALLVGFPIGVVVPLVVYFVKKRFPGQAWLRSINPPVLFAGALITPPVSLRRVFPLELWLTRCSTTSDTSGPASSSPISHRCTTRSATRRFGQRYVYRDPASSISLTSHFSITMSFLLPLVVVFPLQASSSSSLCRCRALKSYGGATRSRRRDVRVPHAGG